MNSVRRSVLLVAVAALLALPGWCGSASAPSQADWPMFGYGPERGNAPVASMGITAADLGHLVRRDVRIDGTVISIWQVPRR